MDNALRAPLDWIASQSDRMIALTERWAAVNSGSDNLAGLRTMRAALAEDFAVLGGVAEVLPLSPITRIDAAGAAVEMPMAEALRITKRPEAPIQILLVGHMDTVYGIDHPFQKTKQISENILNGPGVADLKGGLAVMLHALMALERSPWAGNLGWQVLLNPDEEIGSVASDPLLKEAASGKTLGLVYEPALADGTLAGVRKGSGNFTFIVRGRAAHAGRNPEAGRNAIAALAEATSAIFALNGQREEVTINPGKVEGGGALNVVPDLAILRFNIRTREVEDEAWVLGALNKMVDSLGHKDGFAAELHGHFTRKPKPMAPAVKAVFDFVQACGAELGLAIGVKPSGGCCDGNNLWHYGLPNVDTLGVRGANIHSAEEICYLDSFVERAQLSALMLMKLAKGEAVLPLESGRGAL
ncbi:MAG: hydrolase [Alphaproteobacteria bacterium]|nr:hydrolase [Alphaproteobacteria bacterium]